MASLKEYAATKSTVCGVCRLDPDTLEEVNDGFRSGLGSITIRNWLLNDQGIDWISDPMLRHHQRSLHHQESA